MSNPTSFAAPVGRTLLASVFLLAGINKLSAIEGTQGYMASVGLPEFLFWPTVGFEIFAAIAIIVGFYSRTAALLLAGFSLATAFLFHFNFADQIQSIMFLKNVSIAGGLLLLVSAGPGPLSVNNK